MDLGLRDDLTPGLWQYVTEVAARRLENNKTRYHIDKYGSRLEEIGAAAEIAARRFLKLGTHLHEGFDNGIDFYWHGWSIDVKGTSCDENIDRKHLQWPIYKEVKCDIAVIVAVDLDNMMTVPIGFTVRSTIQAKSINHMRDTPCREVPFGELCPMKNLVHVQYKRGSCQEPQFTRL